MKKRDLVNLNNPQEVYIEYHRRYLWNFLLNLFKWEGMPETINLRFFNDKLLSDGFAPIFRYTDGRLLCSDGAISGLDNYYRPTKYTSANAIIKTVRRPISYIDDIKPNGAVVCFNTGEYQTPESLNTMVEIFAYRLAQCDLALDVSIINSKVVLIPVVSDEKQAIRTEKVLKEIYEGKPSVLSYKTAFDKGLELTPINAKNNIVTAEIEDAKRNVFTEFLTRLGVNCLALDKKERTNLAEMNSNDEELYINSCIYLNARREFCEVLNKTFGLNVSVDLDRGTIERGLVNVSLEQSRSVADATPRTDVGD